MLRQWDVGAATRRKQIIKRNFELGNNRIKYLVKFVTEEAYNNSKFVEDIYRHIMYECNKVSLIKHVKIHVSNEESIHQHNAVACIGF